MVTPAAMDVGKYKCHSPSESREFDSWLTEWLYSHPPFFLNTMENIGYDLKNNSGKQRENDRLVKSWDQRTGLVVSCLNLRLALCIPELGLKELVMQDANRLEQKKSP